MQMHDDLAGVRPAVGYHAVALRKPQLGRNLPDRDKKVAHQGRIFLNDLVGRGDLLLRDHQDMDGGLGVKVFECQAAVVFINDFGRDFAIDDPFEDRAHGRVSRVFANLVQCNRLLDQQDGDVVDDRISHCAVLTH